MEKKLTINCDLCDTRKVSEATLAAYDSITINSDLVLTNAESRRLLATYDVSMNSDTVMDIEDDVQLSTINGSYQIKPTDRVTGRQYLLVNGILTIEPGSEQVLDSYVRILVNGVVTMPDSLSGYRSRMTVNGETSCYPDGAILLKNNTRLDRTFFLRAKSSPYWAWKRLIAVDPSLDAAGLAKKGATFSAREMILAESMVEDLVPVIDEKAQIIIVPDGTQVILDDVALDSVVTARYGTSLYIVGDLDLTQDSLQALASLTYLAVRGDVTVPENMKGLLLEKADTISGDVRIKTEQAGRVLSDRPVAQVTAWLLEQGALHVEDCVQVKIDANIPKAMLLERLTISDCVFVFCTPDQEDVVSLISSDVQHIQTSDDPMAASLGGASQGGQVINCDKYVM